MDTLKENKGFEKLVSLAREEREPSIDVSGSVALAIQERESENETTFEWLAAGSMATAAAVAIWALSVLAAWTDPINGLFVSLEIIMF